MHIQGMPNVFSLGNASEFRKMAKMHVHSIQRRPLLAKKNFEHRGGC